MAVFSFGVAEGCFSLRRRLRARSPLSRGSAADRTSWRRLLLLLCDGFVLALAFGLPLLRLNSLHLGSG